MLPHKKEKSKEIAGSANEKAADVVKCGKCWTSINLTLRKGKYKFLCPACGYYLKQSHLQKASKKHGGKPKRKNKKKNEHGKRPLRSKVNLKFNEDSLLSRKDHKIKERLVRKEKRAALKAAMVTQDRSETGVSTATKDEI